MNTLKPLIFKFNLKALLIFLLPFDDIINSTFYVFARAELQIYALTLLFDCKERERELIYSWLHRKLQALWFPTHLRPQTAHLCPY